MLECVRNPHSVPPLQTHGLYDEVWTPPDGGRFVRFEASDEFWMRPLGLGTVEKVLRPLYDVRRNDSSLIGYVTFPPGRRDVQLPVIPKSLPVQRSARARSGPDDYQVVELRRDDVAVFGKIFAVWSCDDAGAAMLLEAGIIKAVGPDRLQSFVHEQSPDRWRDLVNHPRVSPD